MSNYLKRYRIRQLITWPIVLLLFMSLVALNLWLMGSGPPQKVRIATGDPNLGAYAKFGHEYEEQLAPFGLEAELVKSSGSRENLELLINGEVDLAFVQAGIFEDVDTKAVDVRSLAAVYLAPIWVFYRAELGSVDYLSELAGKKLALGPQGSGTQVIAQRLLIANGVSIDNADSKMNMPQSANALINGDIDVAFFALTYQSPQMQKLLVDPNIKLFDFRRSLAYTRTLPYLRQVTLGEGSINLEANLPRRDFHLLATSVMLVARDELHPRAVEQILLAAKEIHGRGDVMQEQGEFPSLKRVDIPSHPTAEQFFKSGESWLSRLLPYAILRWVLKLQLILLPLIVLWLPLAKLLPALYQYRINQLLKLHYGVLRDAETQLAKAKTQDEFERQLEALDRMQQEMERLSRKIPAHLQREVYHWRSHIALVRQDAEKRRGAIIASGQESRPKPKS